MSFTGQEERSQRTRTSGSSQTTPPNGEQPGLEQILCQPLLWNASSPDPEFLFSEFAKNSYSFARCGGKHLPSQLAGWLRQEEDLSPEVQDQTRVTARRMATANFQEVDPPTHVRAME